MIKIITISMLVTMAVTINSTIHPPHGSNIDTKYIELVLVIDRKVFRAMNRNVTRVHEDCKEIVKVMNSIYAPLNIYIALTDVVIWKKRNQAELSTDGDRSLRNFLNYRKTKLNRQHPNDNAHLITGERFEGGVFGKALKGPICTHEFSGGVSVFSSDIRTLAIRIAHEIAHNLGSEHDEDFCSCPEEDCIMSRSQTYSKEATKWSSCSIEDFRKAFAHGMDHCLKNIPEKIFDSPTCGNGFMEEGEECDCGLPEDCENPCCDPQTCLLAESASCATGSCCDLKTCQPVENGSLCRESRGECDESEFCDGENEFCPQDEFKPDAKVCGGDEAFCYRGSCQSHDDQCKKLWGQNAESTQEICSKINTKGNRHGNCGYNYTSSQYLSCESEDVMCGRLHCERTIDRLEYGMEAVSTISHYFTNFEGRIVRCVTGVIDLGLDTVDPGLTPNGAKCGENKMCLDQKCVEIDDI